jgi:hypothetical protein
MSAYLFNASIVASLVSSSLVAPVGLLGLTGLRSQIRGDPRRADELSAQRTEGAFRPTRPTHTAG